MSPWERHSPAAGSLTWVLRLCTAASDSMLGESYEWSVRGSVVWGWFGYSISSAGDVNGDGFDDVIVGAPRYTNGEADEGAAYLYRGSVEGLSESAAWIGEGEQVGAEYGISVGRAGDVNGDGYSDVVVGAFRYTHGEVEEGRAFVYYGSSTGLCDSLSWTAESDQGWRLVRVRGCRRRRSQRGRVQRRDYRCAILRER